jgi:glycosyltransferase involved in cell wall biosynthesis
MSDIPPFRDQLEFYRTKAELFDPRNSKSLADAVIRVLENPDLARRMVTTSQKVLQEYTWEDVAHQYINIFKQETHGITYK